MSCRMSSPDTQAPPAKAQRFINISPSCICLLGLQIHPNYWVAHAPEADDNHVMLLGQTILLDDVAYTGQRGTTSFFRTLGNLAPVICTKATGKSMFHSAAPPEVRMIIRVIITPVQPDD
jgi:hypothetical protein